MNLKQFTGKQLAEAAKNLEHAKTNRQGGLLKREQAALDNIKGEIFHVITGNRTMKFQLLDLFKITLNLRL